MGPLAAWTSGEEGLPLPLASKAERDRERERERSSRVLGLSSLGLRGGVRLDSRPSNNSVCSGLWAVLGGSGGAEGFGA